MVRVNHPPGGAAQIDNEARREPKTVRVSKPPGGESSISFADDASQCRLPARSGASSAPLPRQSAPPSGAVETPAFVETPATTAAASPEGKDVGEGSYNTKEVSSPTESTNGTAPVEFPTESPAEPSIPFPDPSKQSQSDVGSSNESNAEVVSFNGAENGSSAVTSPDSEINGEDSSEIRSEACVNEVATATVIKESEEVSSTSSESHQSTTEINTVQTLTTAESSDNVTKVEAHAQQNGFGPAKEKAPSADQSARPTGATTPTSPTSVSTPKPGEDTTDRMFGQPTSTPPQQSPPRKIKDHMRSNIFMSDEDYTPTRSSRMNAAVITDTSPTAPAAGQRQRIPPGGFSTKLW